MFHPSRGNPHFWRDCSGLDNAGKTTIVKRIMNEDVTTVSPTLGFIIRTVDFMGQVRKGTMKCVRYAANGEPVTSWIYVRRSHRPQGSPQAVPFSADARLMRIGDVGGQKTIRSYWQNYFEKTDALIWVVDATDRLRIDDCRRELADLLLEEVCDTSHVGPVVRLVMTLSINC